MYMCIVCYNIFYMYIDIVICDLACMCLRRTTAAAQAVCVMRHQLFFFVSQNYDDNNILGVLFSLLISLMNRLFVLAKYQITSPSAVSECNTRRKSHSLTVSHIIAPLFARTTFKNQPLLVRLPLFLYTALFHLQL